MGSPDTSRGASPATHPAAGAGTECYPLPLAALVRSVTTQIHPWRHPEPMAKRARGTTRPGQRAPLQRSTAAARPPLAVPPLASPVAPRPATLTDEEAARAAEIEARLVAAERSAEEAARRQTSGRRRPMAETPVRGRLDRRARRAGVRLRRPGRPTDRADRRIADRPADRDLDRDPGDGHQDLTAG